MLIAQVTDVHIGFHRNAAEDLNLARLHAVLSALVDRPDRPDLLLLTGDLTEHGDDASFAALAQALSALPFPVWPIAGNHDRRAGLAHVFPQVPQDGGFLHYAIEADDLRILMLDSTEDGRHGGAFGAARRDWLRGELTAHRQRPTIIVLHHPPFVSGIDWMDPAPDEPWIARLDEAVAGQEQVRAILCGHLHRPAASLFAGIPVIACPSSAAALALQTGAIDPEVPDGRAMIVDEAPGFALHRWDGQRLVTHFGQARGPTVLARYDAGLQPVVTMMRDERNRRS